MLNWTIEEKLDAQIDLNSSYRIMRAASKRYLLLYLKLTSAGIFNTIPVGSDYETVSDAIAAAEKDVVARADEPSEEVLNEKTYTSDELLARK